MTVTVNPHLMDRNMLTPPEQRAHRVEALKNHSYRCGALTSTIQSMLPCLRDALTEITRKNKHGINDSLILELTMRIKSAEELFGVLDEADCEVNKRLGIAPLLATKDDVG